MKSTPLILDSLDDNGRRLTRIESTAHDSRNEAWLQELLYRHPELLPVEDFDETFGPPVPIGREVGTDRGPIDNLYISPSGGLTIVETKLWKNPEKHRTVVAQVIDYAKEVASWDYDKLSNAILASSRRRGETKNVSLEAKLTPRLQENAAELHEFQEKVATNLSEGNFLLLIVGDRISPNIALLTQAIQSAPGLGFTLGLVEMQLYLTAPGKQWPIFVVPEVVGRTVEKTRGVVRVQYLQEKPEVSVEVDDSPGPVSKLDLGLFLQMVPKDLAEVYRLGMDEWKAVGGDVRFSSERCFWEMDIAGRPCKFVRAIDNSVSVFNRKMFSRDFPEQSLTLLDQYIDRLEASPAAVSFARAEKMWVRYEKITPADLRVILQSAIWLAAEVRR